MQVSCRFLLFGFCLLVVVQRVFSFDCLVRLGFNVFPCFLFGCFGLMCVSRLLRVPPDVIVFYCVGLMLIPMTIGMICTCVLYVYAMSMSCTFGPLPKWTNMVEQLESLSHNMYDVVGLLFSHP